MNAYKLTWTSLRTDDFGSTADCLYESGVFTLDQVMNVVASLVKADFRVTVEEVF